MAYFIFSKHNNQLYKIAENENDLNNILINKDIYNIIEESQSNFDEVKYGTKIISSVNNNVINYTDIDVSYYKNALISHKNNLLYSLELFLKNNPNHPYYQKYFDYKSQVENLNVDTFTFPMKVSLEQYFNDNGQPSFNPLQIP